MFWRVVKLHSAQELCGRALTQHIGETFPEVSIEVVQHQADLPRLGVCTGGRCQLAATPGPVRSSVSCCVTLWSRSHWIGRGCSGWRVARSP